LGVSSDLSHAEFMAARRYVGGTHTGVNRVKRVQIWQQFDRRSLGGGPEFTYS